MRNAGRTQKCVFFCERGVTRFVWVLLRCAVCRADALTKARRDAAATHRHVETWAARGRVSCLAYRRASLCVCCAMRILESECCVCALRYAGALIVIIGLADYGS